MEDNKVYCWACQNEIQSEDEVCLKCGSDVMEFEDMSPSERKFKTLFRVRDNLKVLIALIAAGLGITLLYSIIRKEWELLTFTLIPLIEIGLLLIFLELINVFVDIEQSSRTQVKLLHKILNSKKH